ncbi:hypothetical protein AB0284_20445 [Pseudarthrobacter phenanthrenivorans]|uniref:hypothetical protein n=1 Tax=Pseudarthrobacter phenanthrenivorans TaxID=361575 RepID=UPI00344C401C
MDIKEVARALGLSEATVRARLSRKAAGDSAPYSPEPLGKKSGAWFWDRRTVAKFLAKANVRRGAA